MGLHNAAGYGTPATGLPPSLVPLHSQHHYSVHSLNTLCPSRPARSAPHLTNTPLQFLPRRPYFPCLSTPATPTSFTFPEPSPQNPQPSTSSFEAPHTVTSTLARSTHPHPDQHQCTTRQSSPFAPQGPHQATTQLYKDPTWPRGHTYPTTRQKQAPQVPARLHTPPHTFPTRHTKLPTCCWSAPPLRTAPVRTTGVRAPSQTAATAAPPANNPAPHIAPPQPGRL